MSKRTDGTIASVSFIRRHRSFFAGLFLVIPAVIIPLLMLFTLMKAEFMQKWCHLYVKGDNAYGYMKGSPVSISGISIGHVEQVKLLREGTIEIKFKIKETYRSLVRTDTRARFQQKSPIVGEWTLELTGGTDSARLVRDTDTLGAIPPFNFDKTIKEVTSAVAAVTTLIGDIIAGKGSVGQLLVKDTVAGIVQKLGRDADGVIGTLNGTLHNVDSLLAAFTMLGRNGSGMIDSFSFVAAEVRTSLGHVESILANLNDVSGDINPLLDEVRNELNQADRMIRALQQSWIYRSIDGKRDDPLLKGAP